MILKLTGYPVITDGHEKGAETQEELLFVATLMRWILLNESDWTQLQDTNMGPTLKQEWATFRQYLRDLPSTFPNEFSDTLEIMDPPNNAPKTWSYLSNHQVAGKQPPSMRY